MKKHCCILCLTFCLTGLTFAKNMTEAAGTVFINSAGEKKEVSLSGKVIGFYYSSLKFSTFTPKLVEFYSGLERAGNGFEIVFVSNDASEAEMMQYMRESKMPWLAAPYDSAAAKTLKLIKKNELAVKGLPGALVIVKNERVLTETGKQDILDVGSEAYKKWLALSPETIEKSAPKKKEKSGNELRQTPALKLPPPEKEKYLASEIKDHRVTLAGKIINVQFNRISSLEKIKSGQYAGDLRSSVKSENRTYYDTAGISVLFPPEGIGFFSAFIPKFGTARNDISNLIQADSGEVYVRIDPNERAFCVAVGDKYEKDGDGEVYKWSVKTEPPDFTAQSKLSVNDVILFPDQLNTKTVEVVFYSAKAIKQKSDKEYTALISCGTGHSSVPIDFPAEGKPFFDEIAKQHEYPKEHSLFVIVNVARTGVVTLEAKGRRASGSGDDATYKW